MTARLKAKVDAKAGHNDQPTSHGGPTMANKNSGGNGAAKLQGNTVRPTGKPIGQISANREGGSKKGGK